MKSLLIVAVCLCSFAASAVADSMEPPVKTPATFDVFKSLVGDWVSSGSGDEKTTVSYELVAGGSAVVERMDPGTAHSMVTVYHPDGQRVLMTHYCAAGNQPRMAGKGDAKSFTFKMIDITNLPDSKAPHMASLTLTFVDKDHMVQEWGFVHDGKTDVHKFEFERKKSS
jgi:hypothetical protein